MLDALFWTFATLAVGATLLSVKRGRKYLEYVEMRAREPEPRETDDWPRAALIVPVKGSEPGLARHLRSLASQDHPKFDLIVACADRADPALTVTRSTLGDRCRIVVAGEPPAGTGEKVHNLLAAVREGGDQAEILAFADSDGEVRANWLRTLVAPLRESKLGATTTFRWHLPEEGGFWSLMRSVWDASIPGIMSTEDRSFAWGGGMAIRKEVFESAEVPRYWKGAVSDDYRLTHAVREADLGIRFLPEAMVENRGQCTGPEFLEWAVRQVTITRVYSFGMWLGGCLSHILYCMAQALCVAQVVLGSPLLGLGALLLIILPGMARGGMQAYVGSLVFPHREEWMARHSWAYFWMTPVATWLWLYAFLRSATTRRIRWRGRTYDLVGEDRTVEVGRA